MRHGSGWRWRWACLLPTLDGVGPEGLIVSGALLEADADDYEIDQNISDLRDISVL